jgi:hypothetical protein
MKYEKLLSLFILKNDWNRPQFAIPNKANGTVHATDANALIFFDEKLASNIETNPKYPDIRKVVPNSNCNTIMDMESLSALVLSKNAKERKYTYINFGDKFIGLKELYKLAKVYKALKEKVYMIYEPESINKPFVFKVSEATILLMQVEGEFNSDYHIGEYERLS